MRLGYKEWIFVIPCVCGASEPCFTSFNSRCWLSQPPLCQGLGYVTRLPPDSLLWGSHSESEAPERQGCKLVFCLHRDPLQPRAASWAQDCGTQDWGQQMRFLTKPAGSWLCTFLKMLAYLDPQPLWCFPDLRDILSMQLLLLCQSHACDTVVVKMLVTQSCLPLLWPHGLQPVRLLCPWDSPGKSTGVGSHALLQGIFPTQGSNLGLTHCRKFFTIWATSRILLNTLCWTPTGLQRWVRPSWRP